jgi:hypothetical protein
MRLQERRRREAKHNESQLDNIPPNSMILASCLLEKSSMPFAN